MASYELHIEKNSNQDDSSLVLVKFPAMQSQFDNPARNINISIKPKSLRMKLEVELNQNAPSFCMQRAQALARISTSKSSAETIIDKNFYTSTQVPVDDNQLFVAKLVNNKLVCRPISNVMFMRSDFSHFDLKEEVDPREEVKPISVKFAAPDRQFASTKLQQSQQEQDELDEYRPINFIAADSDEALKTRNLLFGSQLPEVKPDPDGDKTVDRKPPVPCQPDIKPKIEKMDIDEMYSCNTEVGSSPRKSALTKIRVKECLLRAKIVSLEEVHQYVKGYITSNTDDSSRVNDIHNKDILDALSEFAVLVRGNWAVKSEVLYNLSDNKDKSTTASNSTSGQSNLTGDSTKALTRSCTVVTGISLNLFTAARDYLLWLFNQDRVVDRLEFSKTVRMPDHDILDLFSQLATFRKDIKKWELKLETDSRFIKQFPEIVQRQTTLWRVKKANKLSIFNG